jgi:hypothetical protein
MLAFLIMLVLSIALIYFGVSLSYRLYRSGAIKSRYARPARRFHPVPIGPAIDEDTEFASFQAASDDVTSRYIRNGLFVTVFSILIIAALLITFLSAAIH